MSGPHWSDYPPDDPPEPHHWCSRHEQGYEAGEDCSECAEFAEEMKSLEYAAQHQLTWPFVWGGETFGWMTPSELAALEKSISTDW